MSAVASLRFYRRLCISQALILLLATTAHGQEAANKETAPGLPVFSINADEVNIDFIVRTKKKPVVDLKPEDIVVTDNGSTVKLSDLRLVSGQSGRTNLITFLFDPLDPSSATNARDFTKKILQLFPQSGFSFSVFGTGARLRF